VKSRDARKTVTVWVMTVLTALSIGVMSREFAMPRVQAAMNSTMTRGSSGVDVKEMQSRLGFLGYYHGKLNGLYNWRTYWAVRDFQFAFGLKTDGIAGGKTLASLQKATSAWQGTRAATTRMHSTAPKSYAQRQVPGAQTNSSASTQAQAAGGISGNDINLIAHVVYGEARGQPFLGQVAVAAVIFNRYHSSKFPHSVPGIIYQPGAFESISNGQAWKGLKPQNVEATLDAAHGFDPSRVALYYWNPATATSKWVWSQPVMLRIGQHVFAK